MKIVMTMLVRDEDDVLDAQLAFHLNAGVDLVIVTDHRSTDGTGEILDAYAREGLVHVIREESAEYRQSEWVTRMARLAATEHGADWVINSDADEFWWPRGSSLKEVLAPIRSRYGAVSALWRPFVARARGSDPFWERMTVRLGVDAPINDPASPYRPGAKVVHRGDPDAVVGFGNHTVDGPTLRQLRGWYPIEVFHFPVRGVEQYDKRLRAVLTTRSADPAFGAAYHGRAYQLFRAGRLAEYVDSVGVDDDELSRGLEDGTLVMDTRLRDALRGLRPGKNGSGRGFLLPSEGGHFALERPSVADDARFAIDVSVFDEANQVRLQRRLDELEGRVRVLEGRLSMRVRRRLADVGRRTRLLRRGS